jgi:hypothetical protein
VGALQYQGRGWTFDDLEEATWGIHEETCRQFYHKCINFGSTIFCFEGFLLHQQIQKRQPALICMSMMWPALEVLPVCVLVMQ